MTEPHELHLRTGRRSQAVERLDRDVVRLEAEPTVRVGADGLHQRDRAVPSHDDVGRPVTRQRPAPCSGRRSPAGRHRRAVTSSAALEPVKPLR